MSEIPTERYVGVDALPAEQPQASERVRRVTAKKGEDHRIEHTTLMLEENGISIDDLSCESCGKTIKMTDKNHYIVFGYQGRPGRKVEFPEGKIVAWCGKHRTDSGFFDYEE